MVTDGDRVIVQVEVERGVVTHDLCRVSSILGAGLLGACEGVAYRGALAATFHGHITGLRSKRHICLLQEHW